MPKFIPISDITIGERQRQQIDPKQLADLKKSILSKGLLHAPVLQPEISGEFRLIAGERRTRALTELHEEGFSITFDGEAVPAGQIPFVTVNELPEDQQLEAELEENLLRVNLTWMEEAEAKSRIHDLRCKQNPNQTKADTAIEIAALKGTNPKSEENALARDILIARNKDNPRLAAAKSKNEAAKIILNEQADKFKALLQAKTVDKSTWRHNIIKGDCRAEMKKLEDGKFAAIISDPPYGISADSMGTNDKHFYDDKPDNALDICRTIISEGFRVTKTKAIMFMFCAPEHFVTLRTFAAQQAWSPWATPLIWQKGTDGHAPWGAAGFIRTYECILFLSKGGQQLHIPGGPDVFLYKRPKRSERTHAAEKPVELLERLLTLSTLQGDAVLDPCAGSGSIIPAADKCGVTATCIELDDKYYNTAVARLSSLKTDEQQDASEASLTEDEIPW